MRTTAERGETNLCHCEIIETWGTVKVSTEKTHVENVRWGGMQKKGEGVVGVGTVTAVEDNALLCESFAQVLGGLCLPRPYTSQKS